MKIPKGTKCHDCQSPIKKGDVNVYHWKETDIYRCEDCAKKHFGTEVYDRIVGYIRPISQWNPGKISERKDKKFYKVI